MINTTDCPKSFIIEGNIGAGKSTFLRMIQNYIDVYIIYEPVDKWQSIGSQNQPTENLLEKFYADPTRWAYTFQSYAFITRVLQQQQHQKKYVDKPHIIERSVYSDRFCFAKNCYQMGIMSSLEWHMYQEWFSWLVENYTTQPAGFIYLQTDPETSYERLIKRNRAEEAPVSLAYLNMLHAKHEDWLIHKIDVPEYLAQVPVLVLECNQDFEFDHTLQKKYAQKITDFFGPDLLTCVITQNGGTIHSNGITL